MPYKDRNEQREYQRQHLAEARKRWLQENGPCVRCGSGAQLEVDHIDPKKKVSHNVWSWRTERRKRELSRCQVLCQKCHKAKTAEERKKATYRHGGERMYHIMRCRCSRCRAWKSKVNARRKVMGWR